MIPYICRVLILYSLSKTGSAAVGQHLVRHDGCGPAVSADVIISRSRDSLLRRCCACQPPYLVQWRQTRRGTSFCRITASRNTDVSLSQCEP